MLWLFIGENELKVSAEPYNASAPNRQVRHEFAIKVARAPTYNIYYYIHLYLLRASITLIAATSQLEWCGVSLAIIGVTRTQASPFPDLPCSVRPFCFAH